MNNYMPGDCTINVLGIASTLGNSLDLRSLYQQIMIYESVLSPIIVAEVTVLETQELTAYLPLVGQESLCIQFQTPSLSSATYNLFVTSIIMANSPPGGKTRIYTIRAVSPTVLSDKTNIIQKSYNTNCSVMIQDIYSSYLNGQLPLITESTQGIQKITVQNKRPFSAIKQILQRSASETNQSSSFLFFANQYAQNFVTAESFFNQGVVANYTNDLVINNSIFNVTFRNIIKYTVDQQFDSTMNIGSGSQASIVKTFDFMNFNFTNQIMKAAQGMSYGGSGGLNSPGFLQNASNPGTSSFIPQDSSLPPTNIASFIPNQKAYDANIGNGKVRLLILGDSTLAVGQCIFVNVLENVGTTSQSKAHPLIAGTYAISKLTHCIGSTKTQPRYTQTLECISGSYASTPGTLQA